jgi:prepilin-type N-terminal cleavage/methylation domain-containing protein
MGRQRRHQSRAMKLFKQGFTLAEALVSMAILALILGLAASVFVGYTRITRQSSQHEQNQVRGYSVLERIEAEVAGCHTLFTPNPSGTVISSSLVFDKVDPDAASRLPTPPDFASSFEPRDPVDRVQVSYSVSGRALHRTTWGVANSDEILLENVLGFTGQFDPPNGVKISLNLSEGAGSQIFKGYGFLWARQ